MRDTATTKTARDNEPDPYARRFPYPKWNRFVTVLDEPALFRRLPEFMGWTKNQHLELAKQYRHDAREIDSWWQSLVCFGISRYGNQGALISGVYRDHWPEQLKDALRGLAQMGTRYRAISYAHWEAAGKRQSWNKHCQ